MGLQKTGTPAANLQRTQDHLFNNHVHPLKQRISLLETYDAWWISSSFCELVKWGSARSFSNSGNTASIRNVCLEILLYLRLKGIPLCFFQVLEVNFTWSAWPWLIYICLRAHCQCQHTLNLNNPWTPDSCINPDTICHGFLRILIKCLLS